MERSSQWVDIDWYKPIYMIVRDFQALPPRGNQIRRHRAGRFARLRRLSGVSPLSKDRRPRMARKPATREEFVLFDVLYENGTQRSNRRVPSEILGEIGRAHACTPVT